MARSAALTLLLYASLTVASPIATVTYPSFGNPAAAAYRVTTNQLPLFNGIAVQDSWAGRVPSSSSGGLFFWVRAATSHASRQF